jgi:hypothetical protein
MGGGCHSAGNELGVLPRPGSFSCNGCTKRFDDVFGVTTKYQTGKDANMVRQVVVGFSCGLGLLICQTTFVVAQASGPSAIACDNFARNYAQHASRKGQMLGGGAMGSLLGLAIGAATGGAGLALGAAIGGTVGMIGGGSVRQKAAQQMYSAAYQDCMAGRVR